MDTDPVAVMNMLIHSMCLVSYLYYLYKENLKNIFFAVFLYNDKNCGCAFGSPLPAHDTDRVLLLKKKQNITITKRHCFV